jgi:GT2 family glycosyltransferase
MWPSITIVFVVYNRRDELRTSLRKMLHESDYEGAIDAVVVDNASDDGSSDMVREEFPDVEVIQRETNIGAPAWNDGFARARGDWVLISDDDCYLPPDGFRKAMDAARENEADLVSFRVVSTVDPTLVFTDNYRTGLLSFWGCSALFRREVIQELGYDPELFIWANELELMMRFFDRGYRHLHMPDVEAQHMKPPSTNEWFTVDERSYRTNAMHWAYIAAKLMQPRDAAGAIVGFLVAILRDAVRDDTTALKAIPDTFRGIAKGLRLRRPVRPAVSRFYRRNFISFASPWWLARPPVEMVRSLPREILEGRARKDQRPQGVGRREQYFEDRAELYPRTERGVLQI